MTITEHLSAFKTVLSASIEKAKVELYEKDDRIEALQENVRLLQEQLAKAIQERDCHSRETMALRTEMIAVHREADSNVRAARDDYDRLRIEYDLSVEVISKQSMEIASLQEQLKKKDTKMMVDEVHIERRAEVDDIHKFQEEEMKLIQSIIAQYKEVTEENMEKISALRLTIEKSELQLSLYESELGKMRSKLTEVFEIHRNCEKEKEDFRERLKQLSNANEALKQQTQRDQEEKGRLVSENSSMHGLLTAADDVLLRKTDLLARASESISLQEAALNKLRVDLLESRGPIERLNAELRECRNILATERLAAEKDRVKSAEELNNLQSQLSKTRAEKADAILRISQLQEEISGIQNQRVAINVQSVQGDHPAVESTDKLPSIPLDSSEN